MKKTAQPRPGLLILLACLTMITVGSCKKSPISDLTEFPGQPVSYCSDCKYLESVYADTMEHTTLSGETVINPYSIENMTEAFIETYGHAPTVPLGATHLYIRYTPKDYVELAALEETDQDLYDQPLDRRTLSEGAVLGQGIPHDGSLAELYTVIPVNQPIPPGIRHEVLGRLYIPGDDKKLEDAALRRTGNLEDAFEEIEPGSSSGSLHLQPVVPIPDNNGARVDDGSAWAANHPSGRIFVRNELRTRHDGNPVTDVQVVVRRLFKIEHMRTDANGAFACKKYFRNKYTIVVKFRNELARVSRSRPGNFVEQFFPIKINLGKWSNLDKGHVFMIAHPTTAGTIATSQWCAAVTSNGVQEFRDMSTTLGLGLPPKGLNILLCSKTGAGHGNTFMLNKMLESGLAPKVVEAIVPSTLAFFSPGAATASIDAMQAFKARAADIRYGYGTDPEYLTTDRYDELVYHELSHAAHYGQVGNDWWLQLGVSEFINPGDGVYGDADTRYAPRIALAEGWAYFMGHFLADRKWGMESTPFPEQGSFKKNTGMLIFDNANGQSSHIHFLEAFTPGRKSDPDRWIPKGLFWDLVDGPIESYPGTGVTDEVSGLTPAQLFQMLRPEVNSVLDYKASLLRWYGKDQQEQIRTLMAGYGY